MQFTLKNVYLLSVYTMFGSVVVVVGMALIYSMNLELDSPGLVQNLTNGLPSVPDVYPRPAPVAAMIPHMVVDDSE